MSTPDLYSSLVANIPFVPWYPIFLFFEAISILEVLVILGIFLYLWQANKSQHEKKTYYSLVTFSLNRFENHNGVWWLKFRTRLQDTLEKYIHDELLVEKIIAAAKAKNGSKNGFIKLDDEDWNALFKDSLASAWINAEMNPAGMLLSMIRTFDITVQKLILSKIFSENFVMGVTCEHYDDSRVTKLRVIIITQHDLEDPEMLKRKFEYEKPYHRTRLEMLKIMREIWFSEEREDYLVARDFAVFAAI